MFYNFDFYPYYRPFRQALRTNHGIWSVREGIIICLYDQHNQQQWGEIAPLPWFASETLAEALNFCQECQGQISLEQIRAIPDSLPACQFAFESALVVADLLNTDNLSYSYLLPAGEKSLETARAICEQQDFNSPLTCKWKIAVESIEKERTLLLKLLDNLPNNVRLRLDANGGLSLKDAHSWLDCLDGNPRIEFLEQPLPPHELDAMFSLAATYQTALALDESVANFTQLAQCYHLGWRDVFVVKPAIAGFPSRLRKLVNDYNLDVVFSSVFENEIGRRKVLSIAQELSKSDRALGLGLNYFL